MVVVEGGWCAGSSELMTESHSEKIVDWVDIFLEASGKRFGVVEREESPGKTRGGLR